MVCLNHEWGEVPELAPIDFEAAKSAGLDIRCADIGAEHRAQRDAALASGEAAIVQVRTKSSSYFVLRWIRLTPGQQETLAYLDKRASHLRGAAVRAAQQLESLGLVKLEDNGALRLAGGINDGERWFATITAAGRKALAR